MEMHINTASPLTAITTTKVGMWSRGSVSIDLAVVVMVAAAATAAVVMVVVVLGNELKAVRVRICQSSLGIDHTNCHHRTPAVGGRGRGIGW